jgi:hypothetical protein
MCVEETISADRKQNPMKANLLAARSRDFAVTHQLSNFTTRG